MVAVLPSEVVAVTNHPTLSDTAAVYLKGSAGRAHLDVRRPFADVVAVLEEARSGGSSPPS